MSEDSIGRMPVLGWWTADSGREYGTAPDFGTFVIERAGYRWHWDCHLINPSSWLFVAHANDLDVLKRMVRMWYSSVWSAIDQERRKHGPVLPPEAVPHVLALAEMAEANR